VNLTSQEFETISVPRAEKEAALERLMGMVTRSEIRIVDIRRRGDQLLIVFRRLN